MIGEKTKHQWQTVIAWARRRKFLSGGLVVFAVVLLYNKPWEARPVHFSLSAHNYTDLPIWYSIRTTGGVEEPSTDGPVNSYTCCVAIRPDSKFPLHVNVRWTYDDVRICYTTAVIAGPFVEEPGSTLVLHFYPEGKIEGELTEGESYPRVLRNQSPKLPQNMIRMRETDDSTCFDNNLYKAFQKK